MEETITITKAEAAAAFAKWDANCAADPDGWTHFGEVGYDMTGNVGANYFFELVAEVQS